MKLIFEGTADEIYRIMVGIFTSGNVSATRKSRTGISEKKTELSEDTLDLIERAAKNSKPDQDVPEQLPATTQISAFRKPDKSDFLIEKFKWDPKTETKYKSMVFAELPDGRVMLSAWACRIYTTREKILAIPYPIPRGYLESVGSINYTTAIRQYREYLATQGGDKGEDEDEDEKYKPMLKNAFSTRPTDHDGGKVEW